LSAAKKPYFFFTGLQVHWAAFLLHPLQTPFSIGLPHFLHGVHPHDWHIVLPLKKWLSLISKNPLHFAPYNNPPPAKINKIKIFL
jgi:hypothetical protein